MTSPEALAAAIGAVQGVRAVLPGTSVAPAVPALVEVRLVVRASATSRTVVRAVAARVREVLGTPCTVRVEVAVVE